MPSDAYPDVLPFTQCRSCLGKKSLGWGVCRACNGTGEARYHPDLRAGEIFVGNTTNKDLENHPHLGQIRGWRYVQPAYDITGKRLAADEGCWAIFLPKEEGDAYSRGMVKGLADIRAGRSRTRPDGSFDYEAWRRNIERS